MQSKSNSDDLSLLIEEHRQLEHRYYAVGLSKQILFSDWYAHYKFFWQHQIEWVDEQKKFNFFRDKDTSELLCIFGCSNRFGYLFYL